MEPDLRRPAAADALPDDEPVIGVVRGDDARAYPLDILRMHEIANDAIDGMHYAASY